MRVGISPGILLAPCSRDKVVPDSSPFFQVLRSAGRKPYFAEGYRQTSALNPELALQRLSDSLEEFRAGHIFCVSACYLIFGVLREAVIRLQLT